MGLPVLRLVHLRIGERISGRGVMISDHVILETVFYLLPCILFLFFFFFHKDFILK